MCVLSTSEVLECWFRLFAMPRDMRGRQHVSSLRHLGRSCLHSPHQPGGASLVTGQGDRRGPDVGTLSAGRPLIPVKGSGIPPKLSSSQEVRL